ncbi:MAG TPA: CdaR family protein [Candidatus Limnocylindria bacterium]
MRANDLARPLWSRRLDPRRIFTQDVPLKVAAIFIAVLFWVANVWTAAPPEITVTFDGRVPVELPEVPSGFVLRGQLGDVTVKLAGPQGVVDRLGISDLHATLDISGIDASSREPRDAKVVVTTSNDSVKVVDVTPPTVSVRLERITSRTLTVQTRFANDPPAGSQPGQTSVSPTDVRVIGPESAIAQIAGVFATVRFGNVTTDLTQSVPAVPVDANGARIDGLQVEPGVVVVTVPLLPTATTRTVPVLWTLKGAVAPGFWISQITTDPVTVTVSGDQAKLATLDRIETQAVDVTGLAASKTLATALVLPDGVSFLKGDASAAVSVTVVPLAGTRPFYLGVQIQNLGSGLVADTDPGVITVVVSGPVPTLEGLSSDQVSALVDAAGKGPGTYTVDVSVRVPNGTTAQSVQPTRVTLTIRSK